MDIMKLEPFHITLKDSGQGEDSPRLHADAAWYANYMQIQRDIPIWRACNIYVVVPWADTGHSDAMVTFYFEEPVIFSVVISWADDQYAGVWWHSDLKYLPVV